MICILYIKFIHIILYTYINIFIHEYKHIIVIIFFSIIFFSIINKKTYEFLYSCAIMLGIIDVIEKIFVSYLYLNIFMCCFILFLIIPYLWQCVILFYISIFVISISHFFSLYITHKFYLIDEPIVVYLPKISNNDNVYNVIKFLFWHPWYFGYIVIYNNVNKKNKNLNHHLFILIVTRFIYIPMRIIKIIDFITNVIIKTIEIEKWNHKIKIIIPFIFIYLLWKNIVFEINQIFYFMVDYASTLKIWYNKKNGLQKYIFGIFAYREFHNKTNINNQLEKQTIGSIKITNKPEHGGALLYKNKEFGYISHQSHSDILKINDETYTPQSESKINNIRVYNFIGICSIRHNFTEKPTKNFIKNNNLNNSQKLQDYLKNANKDLLDHLESYKPTLIKNNFDETIKPWNESIKYCNPDKNNIFFQKFIEIVGKQTEENYPNINIEYYILFIKYQNLSINERLELYHTHCHENNIEPTHNNIINNNIINNNNDNDI
jgi:hypothetical protein